MRAEYTKIANTHFTGCQSIDIFSEIIFTNLDILFLNVTIWHNPLSRPSEVNIVMVDGVGYRMLPY